MTGLLDATSFMVHHRPAALEVRVGYDVLAADGAVLGTVVQVGRDSVDKTLHPRKDDATTTELELRDASDVPVLRLTRQRALRGSLHVASPDGAAIGSLRLENLVGKSRFAVEANGASVGMLAADSWRKKAFTLTDASGAELARIVMTQGTSGDFSHDNRYSVTVTQPLADPVRSLAVAAVFAVDQILWER